MMIFPARLLVEFDAAQARLQHQKELLRQHLHSLRSNWPDITDHGGDDSPAALSCWVRDVQLMCEAFVKVDSVRLPAVGPPRER